MYKKMVDWFTNLFMNVNKKRDSHITITIIINIFWASRQSSWILIKKKEKRNSYKSKLFPCDLKRWSSIHRVWMFVCVCVCMFDVSDVRWKVIELIFVTARIVDLIWEIRFRSDRVRLPISIDNYWLSSIIFYETKSRRIFWFK